MTKPSQFAFTFDFRFKPQHLSGIEWLAYLGQPMLYDGELYVVRRPYNEMTPSEYYRWIKGIRVC